MNSGTLVGVNGLGLGPDTSVFGDNTSLCTGQSNGDIIVCPHPCMYFTWSNITWLFGTGLLGLSLKKRHLGCPEHNTASYKRYHIYGIDTDPWTSGDQRHADDAEHYGRL